MSCDIIKRFIELLANVQPILSEEMAADIEQQLRHEYGGERVYIQKRGENVCVVITERFNGHNVDKLALDLHVSRRTVYRAIKKRHTTTR